MPTIAYLGPEHTNTHVAAQREFGPRASYVHAPTIDDVFHLVERQQAEYGVVPVENSLEGAVTHTLDRFIDFKYSPVKIQGEIEQPIRHYVILMKGEPLELVNVVFSHPQALAQCSAWLDKHLHNPIRIETSSTAEAVKRMIEGKGLGATIHKGKIEAVPVNQCAAIARRELAGEDFRAIPIPLSADNKTRFLTLGLGNPKPGRKNKTSILVLLKDRPGALYDALMPFKREKINLTKIESRPSKKKAWEYYFFIDVEGHESEPRVKRALKALSRSTFLLRVLGSYPITK